MHYNLEYEHKYKSQSTWNILQIGLDVGWRRAVKIVGKRQVFSKNWCEIFLEIK